MKKIYNEHRSVDYFYAFIIQHVCVLFVSVFLLFYEL